MKKLLYILSVLLCSSPLFAQQDEQMSLYMYNPLYYNPAYAGSRNAISMTGMARFQWTGWKGAPMTQWFSVHMPFLNQTLGAGLHMVNDRIGARRRTAAFADISASVRLNKKGHRLAFGLSGGVDFQQFNFSDLQVNDPNDPLYGQSFVKNTGNFGAGIYYYGERHYIGISSPRILQNQINNIDSLSASLNRRHFFLAAGYVFRLNSVLDFKPSTLIKITPNAPLTFDINASFLLYERVWLGAMYRFHESAGLNAVVRIKEILHIGYAYDFPVNRLRTNQRGTHEIMVQLDIKPKKTGFTSPRYF
ncbi:MAG: type IX secretion system membrane protein PorP/SprF [Bacteroidia bacterium]|nr:type IX secretion system membrane protein PorP/SprF [Bacteroidia bacterium]